MNHAEKRTEQAQWPETMSHEEAVDIITRAQKDPHLARELDYMRETCCRFIHDIIEDVNRRLAEQEKKVPALLRGKSDNAISLRAAAQKREEMARRRRELAEAMVIGALHNFDNPDWDPRTDSNPGKGGLLVALLKTSGYWSE